MGTEGHQAKETHEVFKNYLEATLPFAKKNRDSVDREMKERLKKEAKADHITFNPIAMPNPFKKKAKEMQVASEVMDKINRARGKKK